MEGRLLLVDDELPVLDIVSECFVAQGHDVRLRLRRPLPRRPGRHRQRRPGAVIERPLAMAVQLGDLDAAASDAVAAAVGAARRALPTA